MAMTALTKCLHAVQEQSNSLFNKALLVFVPFMVGWFALNLPAGLGLYYFSTPSSPAASRYGYASLGVCPLHT